MDKRLLGLLMLLMFLVAPIVPAVTVTVQILDPEGKALANATVKVIGPNYSKEFTTDSNGTVNVTNLTEGKDYLVIAKGDNYLIFGVIENATDNSSVSFDASKYNYSDVKVSPSELTVKVKFAFADKYKELEYEFEAPIKIYVEPVENYTLNFTKSINKGIYSYVLKEIEYDNETITNSTVIELNPTKNYTVTAKYLKTVNPVVVLLLVAVLLLLVILAIRSGKTTAAKHILKETFVYARKRR